MSIENHIATTRLRDQAMLAGVDTDALELALYCLGEIQDGDFGLASGMAGDVLDEVERRVAEMVDRRPELRVVRDGS